MSDETTNTDRRGFLNLGRRGAGFVSLGSLMGGLAHKAFGTEREYNMVNETGLAV